MASRFAVLLAIAVSGVGCASAPPARSVDPAQSAESLALRVTILEYESALEARDLGRLERIWHPTPDQLEELERLFREDPAGDPIDVRIRWRSVTHGEDLAIVDFDQRLAFGGIAGPETALTAALTPTSAGGWRIAFLGEREDPAPEPTRDSPAPASLSVEEAVGPLSWSDPGRRQSVAHLRADLVRRKGGEWVIVSLTPSTSRLAARPPASGDPVTSALRGALREYEVAFEERDADRLGQVWLMNPYERDVVEELFAWTSMVAISIDSLAIEVEGSRARMDFEQQFVMSARPRVASLARRAFVRALAASDAQGAWDIDTLTR